MLKIVEKIKIWCAISIFIIAIGIGAMMINGLNWGIDFAGGTMVSIAIGKEYNIEDVRGIVSKYDANAQVQAITEGNQVSIRSNTVNDEQVSQMFNDIKGKYQLEDSALVSTDRIGPSVGADLKKSALISSLVAILGILLYVTIRFEFKSGVVSIVTLLHDVMIMVAVYSVLQIPINNSFIAAILTILGYSINDTIVVFDRIRENRNLHKYEDFTAMVNSSIMQTIARSINTALTTLFTITAIYLIGVPAVKEFALPLIIGVIAGSYSSIFIASPLLALWVRRDNIRAHRESA